MSLNVTFNGQPFIIPETGEVGWGGNTTSYLVAIAAGALQKTGGSFTLSSEIDFGASFGVKSLYYKSRSINVAAAGILRLNNNSDSVSWRNAANSGDLPLAVDVFNQLLFNGQVVITGSSPSAYVSSITGTANQVIASSPTGAVTLSLPQSINTSAAVQFGTLGLGSALTASAILSLASTSLGFLPPRMTTGQRDAIVAPATGLLIYNTSTNQYNSYDGVAWVALAMSGGGTVNVGTQFQLGYYATTGTTISGNPGITTSASGDLRIAATSNQIRLGTGTTLTIHNAPPAVSRIINIPDPAADNVEFIISNTPQTMNGDKAFTGNTIMSPITGTFALLLDSAVTNQLKVRSTTAGNVISGGRLGPGGLIVNWEPTGNGLPGDYILMVNSGYKNSVGSQDEFAEIGSVLIDGTVGNETSRMMFNLRGGGAGFLSNQALFSITPITNTGSILHFGPGESVVATAPVSGGGYLWSAAAGQSGLSGGAQPTAADAYTARSTSATLVKFGITSVDEISFFSDTGLTTGNSYTPTRRFSVLSGSLQSQVPMTITPTSNQLVLGTTRTVTLTAPTPATTSRTWTIPDISANATFAALEGAQTITGTKTFASSSLLLQEAGGTDTITIAIAALATSRTYTMPDAGTNASFVMTEGTQTINGSKTFGSSITAPAATLTNTTNQLVLGVTNTTTISATAPTTSRTVTIPDPGAAASFVLTESAQTINGAKTFASSALKLQENGGADVATIAVASLAANRTYTVIDAGASASFVMTESTQTLNGQTTLNNASGNPIHGTNTNDSPAAGFVGEVLESKQTSDTSFPTSGQYGDLTSLSITAGDWLVTVVLNFNVGGATAITDVKFGLGTATGNSATGLVNGDTAIYLPEPGTANNMGAAIASIHLKLSGTTTYYLKFFAAYSTSAPTATGRITANRIR